MASVSPRASTGRLPGSRRPAARTAGTASRWDAGLILPVMGLLLLGLIGVYTASISRATELYGDHSRFLVRQALFIIIAGLLAIVVSAIPLRVLRRCAGLCLSLALLCLVLVLIPGLGTEVNGSTRWIRIAGFSLQPSEIAKLLFLIYLSAFLADLQQAGQQRFADLTQPLILLVLVCLLLMLEPDFGTVAVISATCAGMMWLGGVRFRYLLFLALLGGSALALLSVSSPYRLARMVSFLNPWADPFDQGFQLTQALIAFGRGGLFGAGLGGSVQKLFYLPEAHTDFLLAVLAEELGLLIVWAVLFLFLAVLVKGFAVARDALVRGNRFGANLAYGISLLIGLQAFVNIGVNMGVLPTKGLTLPFMSYGGSSVVMNCLAVAVLARVQYENRAGAS